MLIDKSFEARTTGAFKIVGSHRKNRMKTQKMGASAVKASSHFTESN